MAQTQPEPNSIEFSKSRFCPCTFEVNFPKTLVLERSPDAPRTKIKGPAPVLDGKVCQVWVWITNPNAAEWKVIEDNRTAAVKNNRIDEKGNRIALVIGIEPEEAEVRLDRRFLLEVVYGGTRHVTRTVDALKWEEKLDGGPKEGSLYCYFDCFDVNKGRSKEFRTQIYIIDKVQTAYTSERMSDMVMSRIRTMYECDEYTDLTLIAEGAEIKAHKLVMASQSTYWEKLIWPSLGVASNTHDIPDMRASTLAEVVRFSYTGKISDNLLPADALDLFRAASRFLMDGLIRVCERLLVSCIDENTVYEIFDISMTHGCTFISEKVCTYHVAQAML